MTRTKSNPVKDLAIASQGNLVIGPAVQIIEDDARKTLAGKASQI
jgi:hypothetical protein